MKAFLNRISLNIFATTVFISALLTSFVWGTQVVHYFYLVTKYNIKMRELLISSMWLIPDFLTTILPISFSIAITCVYERLRLSNQLTAAFFAGINYKQIVKPITINSVFMTIALLLSNFFISPKFLHEFKTYQNLSMSKINFKDKNSVVNYQDMSFFVKEKTEDNQIKGIIVCDNSSNNDYTITADKGTVSANKNSFNLELLKGKRIDFRSKNPSVFSFESYKNDIPIKQRTIEKKPYEKFIFELLNSKSGRDISEAHKKITAPFLIFIYAFIIFLVLIKIRAHKKINYLGIFTGFSIIAVIQCIQILIFNISINHKYFVSLFYLFNGSVLLFLIRKIYYAK